MLLSIAVFPRTRVRFHIVFFDVLKKLDLVTDGCVFITIPGDLDKRPAKRIAFSFRLVVHALEFLLLGRLYHEQLTAEIYRLTLPRFVRGKIDNREVHRVVGFFPGGLASGAVVKLLDATRKGVPFACLRVFQVVLIPEEVGSVVADDELLGLSYFAVEAERGVLLVLARLVACRSLLTLSIRAFAPLRPAIKSSFTCHFVLRTFDLTLRLAL